MPFSLTATKTAPQEPGTWTDLSLGSSQFGIRPAVFLESQVLKDYAELHPSLGLNAAGVILSLLWTRLAVDPALKRDGGIIMVSLLRRKDSFAVEVELRAERCRLGRRACLFLRLAGRPAFGGHQ